MYAALGCDVDDCVRAVWRLQVATYSQARAQFGTRDRRRALGYLLAWPGMDPGAFTPHSDAVPEPTSRRE